MGCQNDTGSDIIVFLKYRKAIICWRCRQVRKSMIKEENECCLQHDEITVSVLLILQIFYRYIDCICNSATALRRRGQAQDVVGYLFYLDSKWIAYQ